jgi:hypothetical protein
VACFEKNGAEPELPFGSVILLMVVSRDECFVAGVYTQCFSAAPLKR